MRMRLVVYRKPRFKTEIHHPSRQVMVITQAIALIIIRAVPPPCVNEEQVGVEIRF